MGYDPYDPTDVNSPSNDDNELGIETFQDIDPNGEGKQPTVIGGII